MTFTRAAKEIAEMSGIVAVLLSILAMCGSAFVYASGQRKNDGVLETKVADHDREFVGLDARLIRIETKIDQVLIRSSTK